MITTTIEPVSSYQCACVKTSGKNNAKNKYVQVHKVIIFGLSTEKTIQHCILYIVYG